MIKHVNVIVKIVVPGKKNYNWNPTTYICENSKYLKIYSVGECDKLFLLWIWYQQKRQMLQVLPQ